MKVKLLSELPNCDLCKTEGKTKQATYDTKTVLGSWGFLCDDHYETHGIRPSTKLEVLQKKEPTKKFDKPPLVIVPLEVFDSIVTVKCPACGTPRDVEVDANYMVTCEGCDQNYKLVSQI